MTMAIQARISRLGRATLAAALMAAGVGLPASGDDAWPGLWGPRRDGTVGAPARFPAGKAVRVREAWRKPVGSGFSAIAVAKGRGYTAFSDGTLDLALAFDAATGREIWRAPLGETYRGHDGSKDGPASSPALDERRVFVVSPRGILWALEAATGKVAWRHDLVGEFAAPAPFWGFATSPLVSGRHVIVQAGGDRSGLVAFDRTSGVLAWAATHSKTTGYSSPVLANLLGVPQILALANDIVYAVEPEGGRLLWSYATGWGEEALRPPLALPPDRVLIPGANEAKLVELRRGDEPGTVPPVTAREVWKTPRLKNTFSPTVFRDGSLYGFNSGYLVALDVATGEVSWREKIYGGSLILVDGHVLILGAESGELRIGRVSAQGYEERLKVPVFNAGATSVTGPAFAGGRVFLRNVEEIVALDILG